MNAIYAPYTHHTHSCTTLVMLDYPRHRGPDGIAVLVDRDSGLRDIVFVEEKNDAEDLVNSWLQICKYTDAMNVLGIKILVIVLKYTRHLHRVIPLFTKNVLRNNCVRLLACIREAYSRLHVMYDSKGELEGTKILIKYI